LKVCLVTSTYPPDTLGGVGEVVYNLQKYLIGHGVETYVFTSGKDSPEYPRTIRTRCSKRAFFPMSIPYYLKKVRGMRFDIFNIHQESGMSIAPFIMATKGRTKVVTTVHTSLIEEARALRGFAICGNNIAELTLDEYVTKYLLTPVKFIGAYLDLAISDGIVAECEKTKKDCARDFGVQEESISVIHNGVDLERFSPAVSGNMVRDKHSLGDDPVVFWIGRGEIRKGLHFIIYSLRDIVAEIPSVRLVIVGATERAGWIESTVSQMGMKDNVIIAGKVAGALLPHYYAASNVVVLPSLYEGLPTVMLEAMASGKPVIASRVGGVPEAIENSRNGVLVEPGNVSQLTKSILLLLKNEPLRKKMGQEAREIVEKRHDWNEIARRYLREFEMLLRR